MYLHHMLAIFIYADVIVELYTETVTVADQTYHIIIYLFDHFTYHARLSSRQIVIMPDYLSST